MPLVDHVPSIGEAGIRQLRHDLLNPLNVLMGMTSILQETTLDDTQRQCVQACRNAAQRLLEIAHHLESYERQPQQGGGPAELADLCSIAVARVDKPFERETLLSTIARVATTPAPRILLVDDSPEVEVLVRAYLRGTRCTLDTVPDGERAVAQASLQQYDVVLMDINLPGLDGATAAHAIRAADLARGARPTPIVALSAVGGCMASRDPDAVEELVVLEDPDIAPLVPGFLDNRREDVPLVRQLLEAADFEPIESIGHKMKGTGRSYGLAVISRIGADIELAAHRHDAPAIEQLVAELDAYLSHVKIVGR